MRLRDSIRFAACACWVGVLGAGTYLAWEADSSSRAGVIRERAVGGTLPADLGAQDAPSRLRNEQPTTGESLAAKAGSPGFAQYRLAPRDQSDLPESRVAKRRESAIAPSDGSARGVRHVPGPRASTLLERDRAGAYHPYIVTGYSHGCVLPKFGPEPPPQPMANGEWPVAGLHVAADPSIAFGTVLEVVYRGLTSRLIVGDRGRAIRGRRLDLFLADCDRARAWGRRTAYVREIGR